TESWIYLGYQNRVCKPCRTKISNYIQIQKIFQYIEILSLRIYQCIKLSCISKEWNLASRIYLAHFRDIQYHLPDQNLNDREISFLQSNHYYLVGHVPWMLQLLKFGYFDFE